MQIVRPQHTLVDQVYEAILSGIEAGRYGPDARLIQEELAELLGVSRQPVQQALLLLRSEGVLINAPGRGLMVAPLDQEQVRHVYEIRASLDALAAAKAATGNQERARREGPAYLKRGLDALAREDISEMVAADLAFHHFLYELSGNPLIAATAAPHWTYVRCVMRAVLTVAQSPAEIWAEHEAILNAVGNGDATLAKRLSREHVGLATRIVVAYLSGAEAERKVRKA